MLRVHVLGLLHHPQRLMLAAGRDARRAPLAEVRHENREDAAPARTLLLGRRENRVRLLVGHRHFLEDVEQLTLGFRRESVDLVGHSVDDLRKRQRGGLRQALSHDVARPLFDFATRAKKRQFHRRTASESCAANKQIKRAVLPPA